MNRLRHRGPDATGKYISDDHKVFLAHTRLAIIALGKEANQPFHSKKRRFVLIFNGELYNYKELANKHALSLRTQSDTEVVVELYAKLGAGFLRELNGMFAGAIYDIESSKLFLFRDRMGIKPLYYCIGNDQIIFSSELPVLLENLSTPSIEERSIADFLHLGYIPEPRTLYKEIRKFPAGSYATYIHSKLSIVSYWKPENAISSSVISNENKVLSSVEELLRDSVKLRLMSDVPFGTFLSGGADSGLITAIASDICDTKLKTFNVSVEDVAMDESVYAKEMARIIDSDHHQIHLSRRDVFRAFYETVGWLGEPFADSSLFPTMAVSKFASKHVKMVLSGDGGDELFMGYGTYNWAKRMENQLLWKSRYIIAALLNVKGGNRNNRAAEIFRVSDKHSLKSHLFSQEQNLFSEKEISEMLGSPYKNTSRRVHAKRKLNMVEHQAFFDLTHYLKDDLLVKIDRGAMRYGLEVRVPFLDHRLVELALNISPNLKHKNGEKKYIVKKLLERYYPPELIYRKKKGFSIPLERWMKQPDFPAYNQSTFRFDPYQKQIFERYTTHPEESFLYNRLYALHVLSTYI